jgi:hypothetical protein
MSVEKLSQKFRRLTSKFIPQETQDQLIDAILNLDKREIRDVTRILSSQTNSNKDSMNSEARMMPVGA